MKYYLFTSRPEDYLNEPNFHCLIARPQKENPPDEWMFVGEVEFDAEIDTEECTKQAVANIDNAIAKTRAELQSTITRLEERKANLLSITHQPTTVEV